MTIFFKLMSTDDKAEALRRSISEPSRFRYEVDHTEFGRIPGSPFAYWLTDKLRTRYTELQQFESHERSARQGLATTDDFRFLRGWWEVDAAHLSKTHWAQFARSGGAARYYGESPLVIQWLNNGAELKALIQQRYGNAGKRIYNESSYFSAGFCWPLRGSRLSVKAVGPDSVFGIASKMAFVPPDERMSYLAILNSYAFDALLRIQAGSSAGVQYESGLLARVPIPTVSDSQRATLETQARRAWSISRRADSWNETSLAFRLPVLLQLSKESGEEDWARQMDLLGQQLRLVEAKIDEVVFEAYGLDSADQAALADAPQQYRDINSEEVSASDVEEDLYVQTRSAR